MKSRASRHAGHAPRLFQGRILFAVIIFSLAFGVRVLSWHDTRLEVGKVQTGVTEDYQRIAELLKEGGLRAFLSSSSPLADLNNLGHPPGYSIVIAMTYLLFGESDTAVQFIQITADAFAAVTIFLIVAELLSTMTALVAGILAAFSPQFAWNSVLLLPDSLAVFPILLAIYCLTLALRKRSLYLFVSAGALVGLSCWLRANAMLLTIFLGAVPLALRRSSEGLRYGLTIVIGTIMIVLPLTIRNAIVFHRFIPLSLGAGQTMLEGIAEYDPQARFGIPKTDMAIMKQEAEQFSRPDYYDTLFHPDGVEREHARLARGFSVIRSHPFWFAAVMVRRASSMLRLERARLVSIEPPVTHSLDQIKRLPLWTATPVELLTQGTVVSSQATATLTAGDHMVELNCDDSKYGPQFISAPVKVRKNLDYVFVIPIKIKVGRIKISITGSNDKAYGSSIVETREDKSPQDQPLNEIPLTFVSSADASVRVHFNNEAPEFGPVAEIGPVNLYELGPARFLWTRYPRLFVRAIQSIFLTAVMLPLALIGFAVLIAQKHWRVLPVLIVVPIYYMSVQSIVHTEYRYVLAVNYFLFALVAVAVVWFGKLLIRKMRTLRAMPARLDH